MAELVSYLWPAEEGGYDVTSPLDPGLITQAETLEEAFVMAYDAAELISGSLVRNLARELSGTAAFNEST